MEIKKSTYIYIWTLYIFFFSSHHVSLPLPTTEEIEKKKYVPSIFVSPPIAGQLFREQKEQDIKMQMRATLVTMLLSLRCITVGSLGKLNK